MGLPMRFLIPSKPAQGSAGISSGKTKEDFERGFALEALASEALMVLNGLGATVAGVSGLSGRGARLAGVPDWQG